METLHDVVHLWSSALGLDEIGPDDDFFELGGTSVTAVRLLPLIDERFGVESDVVLIFDHPTPRELATELELLIREAETATAVGAG